MLSFVNNIINDQNSMMYFLWYLPPMRRVDRMENVYAKEVEEHQKRKKKRWKILMEFEKYPIYIFKLKLPHGQRRETYWNLI